MRARVCLRFEFKGTWRGEEFTKFFLQEVYFLFGGRIITESILQTCTVGPTSYSLPHSNIIGVVGSPRTSGIVAFGYSGMEFLQGNVCMKEGKGCIISISESM